MSLTETDHQHMSRALQLAERGMYTTDPNPRVGCVLVKDGSVLGEGWHVQAGGPHAELHALQQAGAQARGATAYVSLEPCCHQGKTPPCTEALIRAGVARVVAAMQDPNPRVAGQGLQSLQEAGIAVHCGVLEAQAVALNPGFIRRMRTGRPYVRCKLGMSLDGRSALANGASQWITGAAARADVQRWRARSSALVTGIGTVLADDPSLTVRIDTGQQPVRQPLRVVVDNQLRMSPQARMFALPGRTLIFSVSADEHKQDILRRAGAEVIVLPGTHRVDLSALLEYLGGEQCNEVLVEAGTQLSGALLHANLIDELVFYLAPKILGNDARGLFQLPALATLDEALSLQITEVRALGEDWRILAQRKWGSP